VLKTMSEKTLFQMPSDDISKVVSMQRCKTRNWPSWQLKSMYIFFVEGVWAWTTFQALRYIYPQVIFRFSCMLKPGRTTRSDKSTPSELFSSYNLIINKTGWPKQFARLDLVIRKTYTRGSAYITWPKWTD
jgi:hypothetical protein